jgi:putative transposase
MQDRHQIGGRQRRELAGQEVANFESGFERRTDGASGIRKHDPAGYHSGNSRNGSTAKTVSGEFGEIHVEAPRDRNASFEPQILKKHQRRWDGFDDKILSMYSRGMSTREIQGHLQEMYGVEVSSTLVSEVTDPCL